MLRIRRACLTATYNVDSITVVGGGSGYVANDYIQLDDGGNPAALVQVNANGPIVAGGFTLVNVPSYTVQPTNPVSSTAKVGSGATFQISVKSKSCCRCS